MSVRPIGLATLLATLALSGLAAAPADAQRRAPGDRSTLGYVTAESRYGSGVVSGPVRRGPHGRPEVRLPGGTWLECGRSCTDTLRRETVDFWRNRTGPDAGDGPGYLHFKF